MNAADIIMQELVHKTHQLHCEDSVLELAPDGSAGEDASAKLVGGAYSGQMVIMTEATIMSPFHSTFS
ncbi:conserved hypothetical protein [Ricinus communis]|uniref:Uncharacterized protein n=1 Tax=Ricinus communis TaxID=3988 RepID=B9RUU2_RICCO|nr:conserved hypothetical protein [Ricinus communis]